MKREIIHIGWIMSSIMLMLLTACSSSDTTEEPQPTMLTIYVYSPDRPVITRADVGKVDASTEENKVTQLQVWIYETNSGEKVGYLSTTETATLNGGQGAVYQIPVPDEFAQAKPNVDVYVMANVTESNCGITSTDFTENTTRSNLSNIAKIHQAYFGLSPLKNDVPADGLPMAGVLKDQPVVGDAPVLRIGNTSEIATVSLTRAVSKLRFFFANTTGASPLSITGITLNAGMIPNEEYLFPQSQSLTYNSTDASLLPSPLTAVAEKDNPADYVYDGQKTAQEYENFINNAQPQLSQVGPYYLRESGKKIEGTISYTVGDVAQTPVTFRMKEHDDFLRNHSWIVYAYYEGLSGMQVVTVDVTPWEDIDRDHTVYNW